MPVCPVSLSEDRRGRLGTALLLLHLAVATLAQPLYLLKLYLQQQLAARALLLHTYSPQLLLDMMEAGVITLVAFHLPSAKICLDVGDQTTRRRWHACFYMWLVLAIAASLFTLVQIATLIIHRAEIDAAFQQGFRDALYRYGEDVTIKTAVDRIQLEGGCCGSFVYRDWFRVPWADPEQVADLPLFTNDTHMKNGLWMVPWVPWSCCNASHLGPCDTLMMMAPQTMSNKQQEKIEKKIGEVLGRLEPRRKTRMFRDADGRLIPAGKVLEIVEREHSKARIKRSWKDTFANMRRKLSDSLQKTVPENATTVRPEALPAFGAQLEEYMGDAFFQEIVPATVSLPTQLFVTVMDASSREVLMAKHQRQFYSPPQRSAVRQRQLNQVGCAEHLSDEVWALLGACYAIYLVVWLLQVAIIIGARWLQTSVDLARRWGADHLTAPGYLLFNWPWTMGEGLELQPPPEDPEAIFHMNDIEEDIMGGLGLDKLQRMVDIGKGLTSGDAKQTLGAAKDTGMLEGTRMGQAASLLDAFGGVLEGGGGDKGRVGAGGKRDDDSEGGHHGSDGNSDDHGGKKGKKRKGGKGKKGKNNKKGKKRGKKSKKRRSKKK